MIYKVLKIDYLIEKEDFEMNLETRRFRNLNDIDHRVIRFIDRVGMTFNTLVRIELMITSIQLRDSVNKLYHNGEIYRPQKGMYVSVRWLHNHPAMKNKIENVTGYALQ